MSKPSSIAYTKRVSPSVELKVKGSANAWWMNSMKIDILIAQFSIMATIPEACMVAEITVKQYKYFVELHPEFNTARDYYRSLPGMQARATIVKAIREGDKKLSMWYLTKKIPEEFGPPSLQLKFLQAKKRLNPENYRKEPQVDSYGPEFEEEMRLIEEKYRNELNELLRKYMVGTKPIRIARQDGQIQLSQK